LLYHAISKHREREREGGRNEGGRSEGEKFSDNSEEVK
jgi:hypothetical protein